MSLLRTLLLAGSESRWLREHATRYGFVRRGVRRFMPGETASDALRAIAALGELRIGALWTHLGENVNDARDAEAVAREYDQVLAAVVAQGLDAQPSVKPTHVGLDIDEDLCLELLRGLAARAHAAGSRLWIDMEGAAYVDGTLRLYRRLKDETPSVGVCLQAYLHRTPQDLEALLPLGPAIRLVKGAYREAPELVLTRKSEVDAAYVRLAERLLGPDACARGTFTALATHDLRIIATLEKTIARAATPRAGYEFEMLYGIQRDEQRRLAAVGAPVRVLVSYGEYWFPWFMRRLAERPANVWFVVKNLLG